MQRSFEKRKLQCWDALIVGFAMPLAAGTVIGCANATKVRCPTMGDTQSGMGPFTWTPIDGHTVLNGVKNVDTGCGGTQGSRPVDS